MSFSVATQNNYLRKNMENEKAVLFTNWTDKDFSYPWDGVVYKFRKGQSTYMEGWKAAHFAKHLVDAYINDHSEYAGNPTKRDELMQKSIQVETEVEGGDEEQLKTEIENANKGEVSSDLPDVKEREKIGQSGTKKFCEGCDAKGGFHKKGCSVKNKKSESKSDEESFEGLKE